MRAMNGVRPRIEIFKPFGEAFELTNKILFQPFDVRKWFVIGFAAFLSGHFAGVGFNFTSPFGNFQSHRATQEVIPPHFEQWKPWLAVAIVLLALVVLALVVALTWLNARGQFHLYRLYCPKSGSNRGTMARVSERRKQLLLLSTRGHVRCIAAGSGNRGKHRWVGLVETKRG
jgi:hypothetical protein